MLINLKESFSLIDMTKKNKTFWGVLGVLISIFGVLGTLFIGASGGQYLYGLPITALAVIIGVLLVAWTISN